MEESESQGTPAVSLCMQQEDGGGIEVESDVSVRNTTINPRFASNFSFSKVKVTLDLHLLSYRSMQD